MRRWLTTCLLALALAGCGGRETRDSNESEAAPALWELAHADGRPAGYLFGTIHALPAGAEWQTERITAALEHSDSLVVEVAALDDSAAIASVFTQLARAPGQPPLAARVVAEQRPALADALDKVGRSPRDFADIETWAAALILAQAAGEAENRENGVDRALLAANRTRPVVELEGAAGQFAVFDRLPEAEQRILLGAIVAETNDRPAQSERLAAAWQRGDMTAIAAKARSGVLASPPLREALLDGRNRAWAARIAGLADQGGRPFVAVGAAHMAPPGGLPDLLAASGFAVRRIQ